MQKYQILSLCLLLALSFGAFNASATESNEIEDRLTDYKIEREKFEIEKEKFKQEKELIKEQREVKKEEVKSRIEILKDSLKGEKDKLKAKIKEERLNGREQALKRFDHIIESIVKQKTRVSDQITKVKALGVDTTIPEGNLKTVDEKLALAKTKVGEINNLLGTSINELSKEQKDKLRILTKENQTLIKEANEALHSAVKNLKEAIKAKGIKPKIKPVEVKTTPVTSDPLPVGTTQ